MTVWGKRVENLGARGNCVVLNDTSTPVSVNRDYSFGEKKNENDFERKK